MSRTRSLRRPRGGRQLVVFESSSVNLVHAKTHHVPHIYLHNKSGPICARMVPRAVRQLRSSKR